MKRSLTFYCTVFVLVAVCIAVMRLSHSGVALAKPPIEESRTQTRMHGIGFVEPRGEVRRLAYMESGLVAACSVAVGTPVKRGSTLAVLDDGLAKLALRTAEAKLATAEANARRLAAGEHVERIAWCRAGVARLDERIRYLALERDRQVALSKRGAAAISESDRVTTEFRQAELDCAEKQAELRWLLAGGRPVDLAVARSEAAIANVQVEEARERLRRHRLEAPSDGVVLKWLVREGEAVSSMTPVPAALFRASGPLCVRAEFDERHAVLLRSGMTAEISGRNLRGKTFRGQVVEVEGMLGGKSLADERTSERRDLHAIQCVIELSHGAELPVGLLVDVAVAVDD